MISKYSLRQRAKAYAHLAQLLGAARGDYIPGLAAVFTITKDYAGQVLAALEDGKPGVTARPPRRRLRSVSAA